MQCEVCGDKEATVSFGDSICGIEWNVCADCAQQFDELQVEYGGDEPDVSEYTEWRDFDAEC
jgi:protein-arginine kinase activator protein McsA